MNPSELDQAFVNVRELLVREEHEYYHGGELVAAFNDFLKRVQDEVSIECHEAVLPEKLGVMEDDDEAEVSQ